ncbi:MAG: Rpn family recombination-promoting nuclease/putative transposase [Spirochaetales bacterium]|nr:Rpn family recombination-promoting nuclease/putative transposase [Spirochaetales bacterium]
MPEHPSNHDRFIKQVLGRPDLAAAFFARTLPSAIVESVRLDELKLVESGFVDAELQESFSDMLFEVPAQDGKRIAFALLFEHKATQDRRTAVQILGYLAHV